MQFKLNKAVCLAASVTLVAGLPAAAQERSLNFALGVGVSGERAYAGANSNEIAADLKLSFGNLTWGGLNVGSGIGNIPENGLSLGGAFRIVGARDAEDNPELAGMQDIDTAVELGLSLTYRETNWLAFGELRQGFGGHDGVTGTLGADVIMRPSERWTVTAGPRISLGDSDFAGTYFGVTGAEAPASNFGAFDAGGGVLGAGLQVGATYQINDRWFANGQISYEKLMNDAANSPITSGGSEDQVTLSIGLSRAFTLRF